MKVLTRDTITNKEEARRFLLWQLVAHPCAIVKAALNGAPRLMNKDAMQLLRDHNNAQLKPVMEQWLSRDWQAMLRQIYGALLTELAVVITSQSLYTAAKNPHHNMQRLSNDWLESVKRLDRSYSLTVRAKLEGELGGPLFDHNSFVVWMADIAHGLLHRDTGDVYFKDGFLVRLYGTSIDFSVKPDLPLANEPETIATIFDPTLESALRGYAYSSSSVTSYVALDTFAEGVARQVEFDLARFGGELGNLTIEGWRRAESSILQPRNGSGRSLLLGYGEGGLDREEIETTLRNAGWNEGEISAVVANLKETYDNEKEFENGGDTLRVARENVLEEVACFRLAAQGGCCGEYDTVIEAQRTDGTKSRIKIGFNYGH